MEERARYDRQTSLQENRKSLDDKRKSVEEKLNAVLEKRISMESGKRMSDASIETLKRTPDGSSELSMFSEKSSLKSISTENIKSAEYSVAKTENLGKSRSAGSSRNDSLENFDEDFDGKKKNQRHEDTVDRSSGQERRGSSVNVSVITSTPIRSKSLSRTGSGDNVVVITGEYYQLLKKNHLRKDLVNKRNFINYFRQTSS